ncbi:glycosyltransferase family A protein [Paenibacillus ihumii]|uniref:glycosyltransferase family A protein n=1 Tax=Paenibacillus ihumii TaxID=687436 RepID=UPI0006D798A5|nr:glycosyltransferase family A protein [Paenibacillus ihumii]
MFPYMAWIWILFSYGIAGTLVHLFYSRHLKNPSIPRKQVHYILVAYNHENQIEWYLRALMWYSCLSAQSLRITILDEGSQDDTLAIIERMKYANRLNLTVIGRTGIQDEHDMIRRSVPDEGEQLKFIDLRVPHEAAKIPYVQA